MRPLYFSKEQIRDFLARHGYTSNPSGLIEFFPPDYIHEGDDLAYLDVNAEAVRKGDEVPDRPIRISFRKVTGGPSTSWELETVEELRPGVKSLALDRDQGTPKISPWPRSK